MASVGDEVRARSRLFEERLDWVVSDDERRRSELRCACPCCGFHTLVDRYSYEICRLCWWEDNEMDVDYPDEVTGGPNGRYSLRQAQENFARYLSKYDPEDFKDNEFVRDNSAESRAKREIMAAFDGMIKELDQPDLDALVQRVCEGQQTLEDELDKKIRKHEAQYRGQGAT